MKSSSNKEIVAMPACEERKGCPDCSPRLFATDEFESESVPHLRLVSDFPAEESTPLLESAVSRRSSNFNSKQNPSKQHSIEESLCDFEDCEQGDENEFGRKIESNDISNGRKLWMNLKASVEKGEFLLPRPSVKSNKRRSTLVRETFQEIRSGMNFTIAQCVWAIVFYLVISILSFTVIFEPEWTIIDTCYFAVATFTTVGKKAIDNPFNCYAVELP